MKKGDIVTIRDYSYAARITADGKLSSNGNSEPNARQQFRIVAVGCRVPTYIFAGYQRVADTVVIGLTDGAIWFVLEELVDLVDKVSPTHVIIFDGKTIKISHASFVSLRSQLL